MSTPSLNAEQAKAAEQIYAFLMDPNQKEIIVSGPGGVGKSFLIGHVQAELLPRYQAMCEAIGQKCELDKVVLTATTNKAAEALSEASGMPVDTIHSFLKLRMSENYKTGKQDLKRRPDTTVVSNVLLVVDEASMDSRELDKHIQELTFQCKIIYVCDDKQLPPVGEKLSVIFGRGLQVISLTQPMRTRIPELQALNQSMRDCIDAGPTVFPAIQTVPGIIDWLPPEEMMALVQQEIVPMGHRHRMLAWSNPKVLKLNAQVRAMRGLPPEWQVGEELVNNSAFQQGMMTVGVETPIEILDIDQEIQIMGLPGGGSIAYREMDLESPYHGILKSVKVPTDRDHWELCCKHYAGQSDWPTYFRLKNQFPDLRQRDASTVHKSQGSSYDFSIIDLSDLSRCTHTDVVQRLMYVAFSRARHRVVLFGQLAPKYGSIII